ncbi:RsmB/NOP family class I SAM-dependent RNA methyltransferase [Litorisediminicola beolgyonensis]|uniref:RsmB/NOP family class I SAM-dependent RNA methyltransferase n=1 Tax=Litorisediminicola beolgyonensis TaxID=1173614 RepID=A0ABW3ZH47_9RHOB
MTPAARVQAAIECLDRIASGAAAEQVLTDWGRRSRYAGSKDRAAVRDHVFDALRQWRSSAVLGGSESGRGRMIGLLRASGIDPETLFTGERFAPEPLSDAERAAGAAPEGAAAWDLPDWLARRFTDDLGDEAETAAQALRHRAPVTLRVNRLKTTLEAARADLSAEGIETEPNPRAPLALTVTSNPRRVAQSAAYQDGRVELQDASSQAIVAALPLKPGARVLDYCAGGGGKALAMAAETGGRIDCHDAAPRRMADLPARAARAGADLRIVPAPEGTYDLVLCDAPCSGSGTWRRAPEAKWRLSPGDLDDLLTVQAEILDRAATLVGPGGALAYATCSILSAENSSQIKSFLDRNPKWERGDELRFLPDHAGDGFYLCVLFCR